MIAKVLQKRKLGCVQLPGDKLSYQSHNAVQGLIWDSPGKKVPNLLPFDEGVRTCTQTSWDLNISEPRLVDRTQSMVGVAEFPSQKD